MKRSKSLLLAAMFSVAIAMPALASEEKVVSQPRLQEGLSDASLVFETDATQPMQLVELSSQEMKETEGAGHTNHSAWHQHWRWPWTNHSHPMRHCWDCTWVHHNFIQGGL